MALSPQVQESLTNAQGELRSAIYYAARNEKPQTIQQIAEIPLVERPNALRGKRWTVPDALTPQDKQNYILEPKWPRMQS